jgi:hypothetical protein
MTTHYTIASSMANSVYTPYNSVQQWVAYSSETCCTRAVYRTHKALLVLCTVEFKRHLVGRQPEGGAVLWEADHHGARVRRVLPLHDSAVEQVRHLTRQSSG